MGDFHEAVILGGGPAGLTAGIYLMRAGINTLLIEKGILGGTPMKYERVENYPGFPEGVGCSELMGRMAEQAKRFGLETREFSEVEEVSREGRPVLGQGRRDACTCLGLIVASGTDSMKLGIPGESELLGRGISYCATCDGAFFRNLDVAVIGGGDAAIQEALALANIARKVYIIHRRDTLRAQKIIQDRAFRNQKIEFLWNKVPVEIKGRQQVDALVLDDTKTGERSEIKVDGVFIYVGAARHVLSRRTRGKGRRRVRGDGRESRRKDGGSVRGRGRAEEGPQADYDRGRGRRPRGGEPGEVYS